MTTQSRSAPPPVPTKHDPKDLEPDEEWKTALKARIQNSLASLVSEAKQNQLTELRKGVVSHETRDRLDKEYKAAMANIKSMASEQYEAELEKERNQRRWIAGEPTAPGWEKFFVAEQQLIMNSIKQTQTPTTPIDAAAISAQSTSKPSSPFPRPRTPESTPARAPETNMSSPQRRSRRRETEPPITVTDPPPPSVVEKPISRHGSERRPTVSSNDCNDEQHPHTRRMNGSSSSSSMAHDQPAVPWLWDGTLVDEPPDEHPRTRTSDKVPERPWESSLSRSSGSSVRSLSSSDRGHPSRPPSNPPEGWKANEEPGSATAKAYPNQVHRRGSIASMRSTGSGASIRPMTETIPERGDDGGEEDWEVREAEKTCRPPDKARLARRDSRTVPSDAPLRPYGPSTSVAMRCVVNIALFTSLSDKSFFLQ